MPIWLQIVIAVFGLISTIFGIFGLSAYIAERQKHKAQKKNEAEDLEEKEAKEKEEKLAAIKKEEDMKELENLFNRVLDAKLTPITNKLDSLEKDVSLVKTGVQKDLYVDLENLYKELKKKGFATISEKRNYDSLYWAYHNLGKNGIADGMHNAVMTELPDEKPAEPKKGRKKKQLLENN